MSIKKERKLLTAAFKHERNNILSR